MTSRLLPEEVGKKIEEIAQRLYLENQGLYRKVEYTIGIVDGATAALTDPSIYEKAGLVKKDDDSRVVIHSSAHYEGDALVFTPDGKGPYQVMYHSGHQIVKLLARIKELEEQVKKRANQFARWTDYNDFFCSNGFWYKYNDASINGLNDEQLYDMFLNGRTTLTT